MLRRDREVEARDATPVADDLRRLDEVLLERTAAAVGYEWKASRPFALPA
jgi:hypothetical protein